MLLTLDLSPLALLLSLEVTLELLVVLLADEPAPLLKNAGLPSLPIGILPLDLLAGFLASGLPITLASGLPITLALGLALVPDLAEGFLTIALDVE